MRSPVSDGKMNDDELDIDASLVRRLLASQFPAWAGLPLQRVQSAGTDNAIFRLGGEMSVHLPRIHWAVPLVDKEYEWLPRLAPHLPLDVPAPLARGVPGEGYPWPWAIYRWLEGESAELHRLASPIEAAVDLARFLNALHRIDTTGGPPAGKHNFMRGVPLIHLDDVMCKLIEARRDVLGPAGQSAAVAAWEAALAAPEWQGPPVWVHGDLHPHNLLVSDGRITAVIDYGCLGVGDPACDVGAAWSLFTGESRDIFRRNIDVDDATWERGRGWALGWLGAVGHYRVTNPVLAAAGQRALNEVLADHRESTAAKEPNL